MATFLSNRDGGKTNEEGHYRFQIKSFTGNVNNGLLVKQNNPLSMSVLVEAGDAKIAFQTYGYTWWNDGDMSVSLSTADVSNPRIDRIVAYVDRSVTPSSSVTNNPNIVKIISVSGSPASSPVAPIDSVVQTAVGAGNPFMSLAEVRVNAGVSTISNGNITDKRVFASPVIANGAVTTDKIADGAVTAGKIDSMGVVDANGWADYGTYWKKSIITTGGQSISPRTSLFLNFATQFRLPVGVPSVDVGKVTLTDTLVTIGFNSQSTIGQPADAFGMFYTNVSVDNSNYGTRRITAVYYKN